jgi:hypothetical protein
MMGSFTEIMCEANGRALMAFLRASGGEAELHARDFGWSLSEHESALYRLRKRRLAEQVGECVWRLTE